jgi:hypothetical protein
MRADRDATSDGGGGQQRRPRGSRPALVVFVLVPALLAVVVAGVWFVHLRRASSVDDNTNSSAQAGDPVDVGPSPVGTGSLASTSSVLTGGDSGEGSPPVAASRTAASFAAAWGLAGTPAQRRAALRLVASPYLVSSLSRVAAVLPRGNRERPQLMSGSTTTARYRVGFSSGEAITVSVDLVGTRWLATRVDPATPTTTATDTSSPAR